MDLDEPVFSRLFSTEWEAGESIAAVGTATLQDYFADIEQWLPPFFFSKFLRECLIGFINQYVMSMRNKLPTAYSNPTYQFNSELTAGGRVMGAFNYSCFYCFTSILILLIVADINHVNQCFALRIDSLRNGGLIGTLDDELSPLRQLAKVITATHISGAEGDAIKLYIKWGRDALKIVHAAIVLNPSMDKTERNENIEAATKMFENVCASGLVPQDTGTESTMIGSANSKTPVSKNAKNTTSKFSKFKSFLGKKG
jgi:hypothetical protein